MQALSPTEDSVKQSASTMLTWKEPVVVETPSPTSALRSSKSKSYGASGSPAPGPGGDLLGVNAVNGQSFKPQKQQYGPMNILHNCMPQNGHQEFGSPFMENSRQNGIPESVMVMPMIDSKLSSASTRSNSSSPPSSRKAVRSRARPRKPEEPVPFLSVDTLPADKAVMEGKSYSSKQLSKKQGRSVPKRISPEFIHPTAGRRSQTPNHPPFSPYGGGKSTPRVPSRAGSSLHNYNSFFTHKNSAFLAGPPSLWSLGNRFWPHQATPNEGRRRLAPIQAPMVLEASTLKANYQLSQPFKHNVDNSTPIERPVSPGQELKESTMLALHEVTQALARQQDPPPSRKGGRLLKGKLKPLHSFKMDGPGMDECQGILTEDNRGQTADKALLLQRKKELLSMLPPDVFQRSTTGSSLHTRPETQGSVHRNSIVSALSLDRDNPANHPSIQPVQLRSQSMVEEAGPVGPFNSMVMMIDDSIFNQVDIPAVEVQQEGGDPEAKGHPETMDCRLRTSGAKEEGTTVQDPERLMAGGDADKLSDDVSESNMSDYLSELEGGRAEILCNMVKKNSQARNDLTQLDNEPSDATELENGYDDEYPLDSVQQKYPALDSAAMSDDRVGNRKITTAMKSESQPNLDDNDSINSKNVVLDTVTVDRNESKSDHPEQSYSPSILKDSITQSYVVAETDEQSEGSMQSENKRETIPTEEHLEQPVVSKIETKVPEKAITDKETKINVYGSATLHEQNKMIMQNASEDVSNGTKLEDNRRESNNDSNTNTVPVNEYLRNESQNSNNIPSISLVDGSVKAAVENDIVSNNVEGTPLREESAEEASSPADDAVAGTPNSDPVLRTGIDALAITLVNEKDVSIVSSKIEQNSPAGDQQQIETAVPKEILSNTADHQSVSVNAIISESVVTQNCENDVVKQSNEELLSSAMKEDSDKEVEKKEEEEVDDDAKDTKEKDDGDRGTDGGNGNDGDSGTGGGNGNNGDSGTGGDNGNSGTGGDNGNSGTGGSNGDSGTGGGNGNDGDSGTGGGNGNDSGTGGGNGNDSGKGGGNGSDGDSGTGGGNGSDGDSGTGGGNGNDGDSGTGGVNGNDGDRGTGGGNGNDGDSGTGGSSGSGTGQGSNSHNDNGGGALGGGGGGGGGGERDGDRNNKDENPGDNKNGNSNNDKEVESEKENQVICFKSLEQLLQEIQAQSSCRKEELLSYNDIPEVDDPVLYCDSCGLDEDTCVCPNSSLHRFLGQDEFQNRSELEDELELFDESSQQQNIVLEYKMLLGEPHPGIGCYSSDLLSSREAWNEDGQHASRLSRAKPNSGVPYDIMLTTGVAMTQVQRPISAKVRPGSSKPSRPSSHQGPNGGRGGVKVSLEDADMSDSGCGSEMSEALTQPSQLLTDEMEKDYNLDDDLDLKAQHQEHFGTETSENVSKSTNLEIVASTKPRHAKNKTDDTLLLAPFPPLCFKINARPPPGKLYYFSYGATMNPTRLSTYIGSKVEQRLWGILFGFALQFNKKGQDIEAGGFANIEFSPESSVEGCVYCLNPSQLNSLDKFMGCPEFYTKIILPVWMANCTDPNKFGVAQYCIPAVMYIAQDKWTQTDGSAPLASEYSIRQCMKGADLLSPAYKQHLQTLVC